MSTISISNETRIFLEKNPGFHKSADIAAALGYETKQVSSALSKMYKGHKIARSYFDESHRYAALQHQDEPQLPGDTKCQECGATLDEHVWSLQSAASLCPSGGTEFNPVEGPEALSDDAQHASENWENQTDPGAPSWEEQAEDLADLQEAEDDLLNKKPVARKPVDIKKMKDRISMLLAKAESTTFEHERDTFNAAAEKLMIRLGISIAELEASGEVKAEDIVEERRVFPGNYSISMIPFTAAVANGFGHITILQSKTSGLSRVAHIIGHKSDVEQFCQLLDSLSVQVMSSLRAWQRENIESRRGLTDMQKYLQHRSFIEGFGAKVGQRLMERRTEEETDVSTGTALVLVSKDARVKDWISESYGDLKASKDNRRFSSLGYRAGAVAGETASLGEKAVEK